MPKLFNRRPMKIANLEDSSVRMALDLPSQRLLEIASGRRTSAISSSAARAELDRRTRRPQGTRVMFAGR